MPGLTRLIVISGLVGAIACSQSAAQTPAFSSARFHDGPDAFAQSIRFPAGSDDVDVTVTCHRPGTRAGHVSIARCSSPADPDGIFSLAAVDAAENATIVPAVVDDRKQEVDFQFGVRFVRASGVETIDVFANNQRNAEKFGIDYVSAQRYSRHVKPRVCRGRGTAPEFAILEMAVVGTDGRARQSRVYTGDADLGEACVGALQRQLADSLWIPAVHDGVSVESTWVNTWIMTPYDLPVN